MPKHIKVAVLGVGNMGKTRIRNLKQIDGAALTAVCANHPADTAAFLSQIGINAPVFENFDEMLDRADFDVLYVCLPPYAHNGQVEAACERKKHVFIEKPIALTPERGRSMADAVQRNGVLSQVGYSMRFGSAVRKFLELSASGAAGTPVLFAAGYECNLQHLPWWMDKERSGGQVVEQLIHLYDLAGLLMGKPLSVSGYLNNLCHRDVPGYTIEDVSVSSIRFEAGGLAAITGTNCALPGAVKYNFKVVCEHMIADFKDPNSAVFTYTKEGGRQQTFDRDMDIHLEEDRYFFSVVRGENKQTATIPDGMRGLLLTTAVVSSSQKGGQAVFIS